MPPRSARQHHDRPSARGALPQPRRPVVELVQLNVRIPEQLRQELRILAAQRGEKLQVLIARVLQEYATTHQGG